MRWVTGVAVVAVGVLVGAGAAGCGDSAGANGTIVLYSAQHENLIKPMIEGFEKETKIKVEVRGGGDSQLSNQIVQEGDSSPGDVFVTENSPAMTLVDGRGGFAPLDQATLSQVPTQFVPSSRNWVGFAARTTVLVYNPDQLTQDQLPTSLMDLKDPKWQGKFGVAAAGADFQAIVSAVLATKGEAEATSWIAGLKSNAKVYPNNRSILKAVNNGELQAGVIYHYYWYQDRAESGADSKNAELKFFGAKDPGAFLSISGAGVLKASKQKDKAKQFVNYLLSKQGQQILADGASLEYPLANGVVANAKLKPLTELDPPVIDPATLNGPKVVELMRGAGLL